MQIVAKAIIDKDQIYEKMRLGVNKIELQLLKDYLNDSMTNINIFNTIIQTGCDIVTIHMPLITNGEELNLEYFTYDNYGNIFTKVCELSEMFAKEFNHKVLIVIHNTLSLSSYRKMPTLLNEIEKIFENVLNKFKNIKFSIENVCPIVESVGGVSTRNGFLFENVDMANYFNNKFNTDVFGTTIDTCHILITQKILEYFNESKSFDNEVIQLKNYFLKNKDTLNNIHLCNLLNKGFNKYEHGAAFDIDNEKDFKFIKEFVELYKLHNLDIYVTLEIIEQNYLNCINFEKTKKCLEYIVEIL